MNTLKRIEELAVEYGNACFDCGAFDGDAEAYSVLNRAAEDALAALMQAVKTAQGKSGD